MARRRRHRRRRGRWRAVRWVAYVLAGTVLGLGTLIGVLYARTDVPPVSAAARAEASIFSYRDGTRIAQVGRLNRVAVPLRAVPPHVRGAVLAAEDRGFYHNPVVSPSGLARAGWAALSGGATQGGSGIAQQYVKVAYLTPERTMSRKTKELFIAVKLARSRSKDWIFEQYLNTVYFGRGAYGVQAAAQAYFRKEVGALTPAEGALLAAVIQAPSYLDPALGHEERTRARWRYVIDGMMSTGVLPRGPRPAFPKVAPAHADPLYGGQRGYLIERITAELHAHGFDDDQIYRRGMRVTTTLDPALQAAAPEAVAHAVGGDRDLETGLVAVRPGTGEILATYGGRDYLRHQYDNALLAALPAGSSYHPFVLASALERGIGLRSTIDAAPFGTVVNDDDRKGGPVNLITATARSYNAAFARLAAKAGVAAAGGAGLPRRFPPPRVRAVDQAAAYAALADGRYAAPHVLARVTDASGKVLLDVRPRVRRAFSPGVAADVTFALASAAARDPRGRSGAGPSAPVAGTIGTTDHNAAAWYCGYTPDVATAVVMYRASNRPLINAGDAPLARSAAKPAGIWRAFTAAAMAGRTVAAFPPPAWVGAARRYVTPSPTPTATPSRATPPAAAPRKTAPSKSTRRDGRDGTPDGSKSSVAPPPSKTRSPVR